MAPSFNPFQYEFFWYATVVAVILGMTLPLLGVVLVLRRFSLIADTLSHVALPGLAVGALLRFSPVYVALGSAVLLSLVMEEVRIRGRLPSDTILALFLYGSLAVALTVLSFSGGIGSTLIDFLFGNIFSTSFGEVIFVAVVGALLVVFTVFFAGDLAQLVLDERLARINGVRVGLVSRLLALATGAGVVAALLVVGVLMAGALLVVPALLVLRRNPRGTKRALMAAGLTGAAMAVIGTVASYYFDLPASATIVLTGLGLLGLSELEQWTRHKAWRPRLAR